MNRNANAACSETAQKTCMGIAAPRSNDSAVEGDALLDDFSCRQHVTEGTERRIVEP